MKITKYAQSTILVEEDDISLLIDPGKYNFDEGRVNRDFFRGINLLLITHKHADHYDLEAVKRIYHQSKPKIYTVREISESLKKEGVHSLVFEVGDKIKEGPFSIESIPTLHRVEGELIDCFGVLINSKNKSLYHTSDTLYIEKKPTNVDVLFVPINNRGVCMSIDEAVRFTREVRPNLVIPVHYDSPKDSHINPQEFIDKIRGGGIDSRVMNFGEFIYVTNGTSPKRRIE